MQEIIIQGDKSFYKYTPSIQLDKGSYGFVYKAIDVQNNSEVALKIQPIDDQKQVEREKEILGNLMQKGSILKNIVQILDFFELSIGGNKQLFTVMELAKENFTKFWKDKRTSTNILMKLSLSYQIINGLNEICQMELCHRDIKPCNILCFLDMQNNVTLKICDIGSARVDDPVENSHKIGTPEYMAPEILNEEGQYDKKVDIWSLGLILYEIFSLKPFFIVPSNQSKIKYPEQQKINKQIDEINTIPEITSLMKQMIVIEPNNRLNCQQVVQIFEKINEQHKKIQEFNQKVKQSQSTTQINSQTQQQFFQKSSSLETVKEPQNDQQHESRQITPKCPSLTKTDGKHSICKSDEDKKEDCKVNRQFFCFTSSKFYGLFDVDSMNLQSYNKVGPDIENLRSDFLNLCWKAVKSLKKLIDIEKTLFVLKRIQYQNSLSLFNFDQQKQETLGFSKVFRQEQHKVRQQNDSGLQQKTKLKANDLNPLNPNYEQNVERLSLKRSQLDTLIMMFEGVECLEKAINMDSEDDFTDIHKEVLESVKYFEIMIDSYDKLLDLKSIKDVDYLYQKGIHLAHLKYYEDAIESYDLAILINPNDANFYNSKAESLCKLGLYLKAIYSCDKAINLNRNNSDFYNTKGFCLSKLGRNEKANEFYDIAIKINPKKSKYYFNKGMNLILSEFDLAQSILGEYDQNFKIKAMSIVSEFNKKIPKEQREQIKKLKKYEESIKAKDSIIVNQPKMSD